MDQPDHLVHEREPDHGQCLSGQVQRSGGRDRAILDRIGTYGRQLGQISDAMIVLLKYLPDRSNLSAQETEAIDAFEKMAGAIADIKNKHKRQAMRP